MDETERFIDEGSNISEVIFQRLKERLKIKEVRRGSISSPATGKTNWFHEYWIGEGWE